MPEKSLQERFEEKVEFIPPSSCHWWSASLNNDGYGQFRVGGKMQKTHRVAYSLYKGPILQGMCVCHSCDNRACVNPDHLWLGTHIQNIADRVKKDRSRKDLKGSNSRWAKLSEDDIQVIRGLLKNHTQEFIAKRFGVLQGAISKIKLRKTWSHI